MEVLALNHLGKVVYDYCGLNYLSNLSSLEMKISKRVKELNLQSLWSYIRFLDENESEWDRLIELLTINETYFYREDKQLLVYKNTILPRLQSNTKPIKVWSAGCSTGEEAYSLAILTKSSGIYESNEVEIVGTDINKKVLNIAQKGVYNKNSLSFRRIPQHWLQTFFHETTTSYKIKDSVKEIVSFRYLNLLDENMYCEKETYDVIFCRNVLIYFDDETIKKVVTRFYNALKKGGYLFLGHAETISKFNLKFETINEDGTFYYRKG